MQKAAVGFDLGTTISVAAYVDAQGEPRVVRGASGQSLIPSALFFSDSVIVGRPAIELGEQAPENYAEGFKRDIGRPHYRKRVRLCEVPPEILTAFLVEHLAENVRGQVGDVDEIVVTVPAYFDERQRSATQRAVTLAGLKVLDIINEPTAAAIAAGYDLLRSGQASTNRRILVYDFGGGTFDATLLQVDGTVFKTLGTDGDIDLGGRSFDERVAALIAESFLNHHGIDPRSDPADLLRLSALASEAKHALSEQEQFEVSFQHAGLLDGFTLTREKFESIAAPLVERTIMTSQSVISDADLGWNDIDEILLVGGSSRIPLVRKRLQAETGIPVTKSERPDELVAMGAALYAAVRSEKTYLDVNSQFDVVNVNAHSLGIQGVDLQTKQRINHVIIPRNTPLPASSTHLFSTMSDGQPNVRVRLLEGESENPVFCSALGQCIVHLDQTLPKGTAIRVNCHYDASGTISVSANVGATKSSAHVELKREGFAELESLLTWRRRLSTTAPDEKVEPDLPEPTAASLGPDSDLNVLLSRLDQLYSHVGRSVAEQAVPVSAMQLQRLLKKTQQESVVLKQLIDVLNKRQHRQKISENRMKMQADLARVRMAWDQTNRLYLHSCVSLGRVYLNEHQRDHAFDSLSNEIDLLQSWLEERTSP